MRTVLLRLLPLLLTLLPQPAGAASAVSAPHLRVELIANGATITPGHDLQLGLHFVLEKGWHIYWSNPGDSGQAPRVTWTLPPAAQTNLKIGELRWPTPQRLGSGPLLNYGYEDQVVLLAPLQAGAALKGPAVALAAQVSWLVCSEDSCLPGKGQLALTLPLAAPLPAAAARPATPPEIAARFVAAEQALPAPQPASFQLSGRLEPSAFHLRIDLGHAAAALRAQFIPAEANQIENAAAQESVAEGSTLSLRLPRSEQLLTVLSRLRGLLVLAAPDQPTRSYTVEFPITAVAAAPPPATITGALPPTAVTGAPALAAITGAPALAAAPAAKTPSAPAIPPVPLGLALAFALLGGALLNLMPCVFPVLSIKVLGLLEMSGADRGKARGHALAYTAGILVSFWMLAGLLIALRYTGQQLGWGFHLQSPRFLVGLSVLLFLLGLNLLGVFEIGLGLTQLGQATAGKSGYGGAFATGVLATVVATPCTAPFMGTAVGFALSQAAPVALLTFSCLGLGLALPYVLVLWIPGLRRVLPRPGAWMETFKQAMGFLLLVTVLWLVWVLGSQAGVDGVVALLAGLLLVGVAGWVLHRWGDSRRAVPTAVVLVGLGALFAGWQAGPQRLAAASAAGQRGDVDDLPWVPFDPQQLAAYRQASKAVFVDFTADWCVSCKVNERLVLRSSEVRARMRELGVVPMKADWTQKDPLLTQALAEFGRSGVPFYVLYGRDPNTPPLQLPVVLSVGSVLGALATLK